MLVYVGNVCPLFWSMDGKRPVESPVPSPLATQAGSRILAYDEKMGSSNTSEEWQTSGAVSDFWTCIRETLPEHPRLEPEGLWLFRQG